MDPTGRVDYRAIIDDHEVSCREVEGGSGVEKGTDQMPLRSVYQSPVPCCTDPLFFPFRPWQTWSNDCGKIKFAASEMRCRRENRRMSTAP